MHINYIFRYTNGSDKIYGDSKVDFEQKIIDKLLPITEQKKIKINGVNFDFDYKSAYDLKYILEVSLVSPDIDFVHTEADNNPGVITHKAIDELLKYVKKEKEKTIEIV